MCSPNFPTDFNGFSWLSAGWAAHSSINQQKAPREMRTGEKMLTQLFTLVHCEATRSDQLVNAAPHFFQPDLESNSDFFSAALLRFWMRTAMRHGWASCSWLFFSVREEGPVALRASSLLSSMVFCNFSTFSLTAWPTKSKKKK